MKFMRKGSKVSIEEVNTSNGLEYNIMFDAGERAGEITVAKCWDYLLAEKLRDATSEYMAEEYKVVGQEDAEMLDGSDALACLPDLLIQRHEARLHRFHEQCLGLACNLGNLLHLGGSDHGRLLAQYGLVCLEGFDGPLVVVVMGECQINGIDIRIGQKRVVVTVCTGVRVAGYGVEKGLCLLL